MREAWLVVSNGLWILGLSNLLTAFSYHDWLAKTTGRRRRELWPLRSWRLPSAFGMLLTCAGWGLAQADRGWQKTLWCALSLWFAWDVLEVLRRAPRKPAVPD